MVFWAPKFSRRLRFLEFGPPAFRRVPRGGFRLQGPWHKGSRVRTSVFWTYSRSYARGSQLLNNSCSWAEKSIHRTYFGLCGVFGYLQYASREVPSLWIGCPQSPSANLAFGRFVCLILPSGSRTQDPGSNPSSCRA